MNESSLGHVVNEVKELINEERELVVLKFSRDQNSVADRLANVSRAEHLTNLWLQNAP